MKIGFSFTFESFKILAIIEQFLEKKCLLFILRRVWKKLSAWNFICFYLVLFIKKTIFLRETKAKNTPRPLLLPELCEKQRRNKIEYNYVRKSEVKNNKYRF